MKPYACVTVIFDIEPGKCFVYDYKDGRYGVKIGDVVISGTPEEINEILEGAKAALAEKVAAEETVKA